MDLKIQFISFVFSFLFGVFLFIIFEYFYVKKYRKRKKYYLLINLVISIIVSIGYFVLLYFINNGYLHLYFLLLICFGFLLTYTLYKKYVNKL